MLQKIIFVFFLFALIFSGFGLGIQSAQAQIAPSAVPPGCLNGLGYSITNGVPCNGSSVAILNVPGCTSALDYSVTNGVPCNGTSVATMNIPGCATIFNYSITNGVPCNGTRVATMDTSVGSVTTPGLPTTGNGGSSVWWNIILLLASGLTALFGSVYLVQKYRASI